MQQKLIVEGKDDAIVISKLREIRKGNRPLGYNDKTKYRDEFIKLAKSIDKVKKTLVEQLDSPDVDKIGVMVDANVVGFKARIDMLADILTKKGLERTDAEFPTWKSSQNGNNLEVSIWVMPDNKSSGYLEHFLYNLIPDKHIAAREQASQMVEDFYKSNPDLTSESKKQKAKTYAYLSLMKKPGLPFGTAMTAGYFDANHPTVNVFETWFKHTFILEDQ